MVENFSIRINDDTKQLYTFLISKKKWHAGYYSFLSVAYGFE